MDEHWEPGPPFRVVAATETYDRKFQVLDIEHTDKSDEKGVGAFSLPIVITICLVMAILGSLLFFFIRRFCFPIYNLVEIEDEELKNGKKLPV